MINCGIAQNASGSEKVTRLSSRSNQPWSIGSRSGNGSETSLLMLASLRNCGIGKRALGVLERVPERSVTVRNKVDVLVLSES